MRHVREQWLFYSQLQRNSKVPSRQLRDWAATPTPSLRLVLSLEAGTFPPTKRRQPMSRNSSRWRTSGVRIIRPDELDDATAQTLGMRRRAAVTTKRTGATKLWAGTVTIEPAAKTGAHHHGDLESVIYVVSGLARMRWGDRLEFVAEAAAGDFIYVPPYVPHQEINASEDARLHCVLARSGQQGLVVNLDITPAEVPELVRWIYDLHK